MKGRKGTHVTVHKMRRQLKSLPKTETVGLAKASELRLAFLVKWSTVTMRNSRSPQERREQFKKMRGWHKLHNAKCWVCERIAKLSRHHIIQIQNGGNNEGGNLVTICNWCHAEVHPWLDAPDDHPIVVAAKELEAAPF